MASSTLLKFLCISLLLSMVIKPAVSWEIQDFRNFSVCLAKCAIQCATTPGPVFSCADACDGGPSYDYCFDIPSGLCTNDVNNVCLGQ